MYDDLARTQNPTRLEWFVVHAVIPTVLVTAALHWSPAVPAVHEQTYTLVCPRLPEIESWPPIPDVFR